MFDDDDEDNFIAPDFHSLVFNAQVNELEAEEKRREAERQRARELAHASQPQARTLMQIIGARTQKEIEQLVEAKTTNEEKRDLEAEKKRKEEEANRLKTMFPPPNL
jgi:hypothetical protein